MRRVWKFVAVLFVVALVACTNTTQLQHTMTASLCGEIIPDGSVEVAVSTKVHGYLSPSVVNAIKQSEAIDDVIVLQDSPGGFVRDALQIVDLDRPVRISGQSCSSACLIVLIKSDKACIERNVKQVTFHSIMSNTCVAGEWRKYVNRKETLTFLNTMEEPLRQRLQHLAEAEAYEVVSTDDFLSVYPEKECR